MQWTEYRILKFQKQNHVNYIIKKEKKQILVHVNLLYFIKS